MTSKTFSLTASALLALVLAAPHAAAHDDVFTDSITSTDCSTFQGKQMFCVTLTTDAHFNCLMTGPHDLSCDGWVSFQGTASSPQGLSGTVVWHRSVSSDFCGDSPLGQPGSYCPLVLRHVDDLPLTQSTYSFGPTLGVSSVSFSQFVVVNGLAIHNAYNNQDGLIMWIHAHSNAFVADGLTFGFGAFALADIDDTAMAYIN